MAIIDLIVLGMLKRESLSAYDIQKLVEYRNISKWVKISTPSIYKKVIQLADKGFIESETIQGENLADKVVYSLTDSGNMELQKLMEEIADSPIRIFLDFNAVIVNIDCIPLEQQKNCILKIEKNIKIMKSQLEENRKDKENNKDIPEVGLAVLEQQYILITAIEKWIQTVKKVSKGELDLDDKKLLLDNIDKIHTTEMGVNRIKNNLKIDVADVVHYCKNKILNENCMIYKMGKNWYCEIDDIKITINSYSYTIITAHALKR